MKERQSELVLFGSIFLLILAGCKGGGTSTSALTMPFLGGDGGVEIGFLEGNPPAEVTDGNTFPFQAVVSLKNIGEYDINKDTTKISLIGFLPSQFGIAAAAEEAKLKDQKLTSNLEGRKKDAEGNIIESVENFFTFPDNADSAKTLKFAGKTEGNTVFIFRANFCYNYSAKAISELCVLQNQIDKAPDAICNPTEPKATFSSGSPIKVTSFRENVAGKDKVQFSFDVSHSGTGSIFEQADSAVDCPKDPTGRRTKEDQVLVTVDTGLETGAGKYDLNCVGLADASLTIAKQSGKLKLVNDKRTVTCTLDLPAARTDFKKPIDILVGFNYAQNADKEVLVKHLIG